MTKYKKLFPPVAIALIIILGVSTTVLGISTAKLTAENREPDINFDHPYPLVTDEETALKITEAVIGRRDFDIIDLGDYWLIKPKDIPGYITIHGTIMFIRKVDGAVVFHAEGERGDDDCIFSERDYRHAQGELFDYYKNLIDEKEQP